MSIATPQRERRRRASRLAVPAADRWAPLAAAVLTLLAVALRVSQLHQSLYGDEVWTFQDIFGRSLNGVISNVNTGAENSPPLFFILAWLTAKLGDPTILIRLPSVVVSVATVPLVYLLGRDTFGRRAGVTGAAIVALGPFTVYYGIEARPYALMAFFTTLSTVALLRAVRSGGAGWWLLYGLAATGAAYSHYTAIFVLLVQGAWSLWMCRRRPLPPLLSAGLGVVLYLPWLPNIRGKALAVIGFLEPLNVHHVVTDLPRPLVGYPYASLGQIPSWPGLAVIVAALALGLAYAAGPIRRGLSRRSTDPARLLVVLLALAAPAGLLLYSVLFTDLWIARGLYSSLPAQAVVAGALLALVPGRTGLVATLAVLATLAAGAVRAISPTYRRPAFRTAASYLDRVAKPRDLIVMYPSFEDLAIPAQFHRPHELKASTTDPWHEVPPGGTAFAVIDDSTAVQYHIGTPHPKGFRLVHRRHFTGLVWFSVLTYRRLPRAGARTS